MSKYYIGIDNGTTGSIGIVSSDPDIAPKLYYMPVFKRQDYTKKKKNITRISYRSLYNILECYSTNAHFTKDKITYHPNVIALVERPMVNPGRFMASISAVRALEVTLIVLEELMIPYQFIDSKQWQKEMLPQGIKGSTELKQASRDIGERLFPQFRPYKKTKDADGILIAEWAKRNNL